MFEFFIAKKYLIPKKKQLSASLIAALSVLVISLVVWLLLLFLSITHGIEKNWLTKLTSLHAPIKLSPTDYYYRSYYHQIDQYSSLSNYRTKSFKEKLEASFADPYDPSFDQELPSYFPTPDKGNDGNLKDPLKLAYESIESLKQEDSSIIWDFFNTTGALLKLKLIREDPFTSTEHHSFLTQMCFASSFSEKSPYVHRLLLEPTKDDLKHLFYLSSLKSSAATSDQQYLSQSSKGVELKKRIQRLFSFIHSLEGSLDSSITLYYADFPQNSKLEVKAFTDQGKIKHFLLASEKNQKRLTSSVLIAGKVFKKEGSLFFESSQNLIPVEETTPFYLETPVPCSYNLSPSYPSKLESLATILIAASTSIQGHKVSVEVPLSQINISSSNLATTFSKQIPSTPPWVYFQNGIAHLPTAFGKDIGILLPKHFKNAGVLIGDKGYLSYGTISANAAQEQRLSVFVAGFYDPGVLSVGARALMMDTSYVDMIANANAALIQEEKDAHGIVMWFSDLKKTKEYSTKLQTLLDEKEIGSYFKISTFYDYDFAKDLLTQFQSDRNLFTLIGIIILLVACSNIISFLILMINDKKKEIGIFLSMGASQKSISLIFSFCGAFLGLMGSAIGSVAAYFTLKHIDLCVGLLSQLQGHTLLHENFYGNKLPTSLSTDALLFIIITTPLLSLMAAWIPARKASRLQPTTTLKSE